MAKKSAFDALAAKLGKRKGVSNPDALAIYIGDKKYGKRDMAKKSDASREADRAARNKRLRKRKHH